MPLTYKEVAEIIKIIDASNLDEIVIEMDGAKMHIRRNAARRAGCGVAGDPRQPRRLRCHRSSCSEPTAHCQPPQRAQPRPGSLAGRHAAVRSPMVGVFYRAPSPKDPPFVEVGSMVKRGDPLCLVEVMKLFTTIAADQDGRIAQILPANGDLVEFDQVLFVVEPA